MMLCARVGVDLRPRRGKKRSFRRSDSVGRPRTVGCRDAAAAMDVPDGVLGKGNLLQAAIKRLAAASIDIEQKGALAAAFSRGTSSQQPWLGVALSSSRGSCRPAACCEQHSRTQSQKASDPQNGARRTLAHKGGIVLKPHRTITLCITLRNLQAANERASTNGCEDRTSKCR